MYTILANGDRYQLHRRQIYSILSVQVERILRTGITQPSPPAPPQWLVAPEGLTPRTL